jgi:peptidoglycan/LPS O-acetylase OafA/YrhL
LNISSNNFDLIRLFAATQVVILHAAAYLWPNLTAAPVFRVLAVFPGVPIFFFVSGFLISRSFEKTAAISDYAQNRALRIFPALHVCVGLNIALIAATGYFLTVDVGAIDILLLYLAKTTFLQFYNPEFMRGFGDGVLNGALWTICVELQFYLLTPVIYWLTISDDRRRSNLLLVLIMLASAAFNRVLYGLAAQYGDEVLWKLARVSFLPWIYMFVCGILLQRNFDVFARFFTERRALMSFVGFTTFALLLQQFDARLSAAIEPILFFPLAAVVALAAYTKPTLARSVLRGNDVSYGLYIYHTPVINMFLFYSVTGGAAFWLTLVVSFVLAILSWVLVERPCLRRKRSSSHRVAG